MNARGFGSSRYIFALPDLACKADIRQPEILDAKDSISTCERGIKFSTVLSVTAHYFGTKGSQFPRGRLLGIAGQRADLPTLCQKFSCHCSSLLTSCAGDGDGFVVHNYSPFTSNC